MATFLCPRGQSWSAASTPPARNSVPVPRAQVPLTETEITAPDPRSSRQFGFGLDLLGEAPPRRSLGGILRAILAGADGHCVGPRAALPIA